MIESAKPVRFTRTQLYALAVWLSDYLSNRNDPDAKLFQTICARIETWPLGDVEKE